MLFRQTSLSATYLFDLKAEIDKRKPMSAEEQGQILDQLHERLVDGHDSEAIGQASRRSIASSPRS